MSITLALEQESRPPSREPCGLAVNTGSEFENDSTTGKYVVLMLGRNLGQA